MSQWPTGTGTTYTGPDLPYVQDAAKRYPARYYACMGDNPMQGFNRVVAWIDAWAETNLDWLDQVKTKIPMTQEQWDYHMDHAQAIYENGAFADFVSPPPTLKQRAQSVMRTDVQQQATFVTAMGETFGPNMRAYVQKLRAIIDGSDTTSTELPSSPSDATT